MMNKKGVGMIGVVIIVAVVAVAIFLLFGVFQGQLGVGDNEDTACSIDPIITLTALDNYNGSVLGGVTIHAEVDGQYIGTITSGTTKFSRGNEVRLLLSKSDMLDVITDPITIKCGENRVVQKMYGTNDQSFRIFGSAGTQLTDSATGGATNQSTSASPITLDLRIDSLVDESSGDLVVVVEFENTTEVDSINLAGNGASSTTVPEFYAVNSANAIVKAFNVPALIDGDSKSFTLTLSPESGQTIGAGDSTCYVTAYSKQAFVDTDNSFVVGVENSDGTTKAEDDWDYDFVVT